MNNSTNESNYKLLQKIEKILHENNIRKSDVADKLEITRTALSTQLRSLRNGKNIPIKTLFVIEELSGEKIFNI